MSRLLRGVVIFVAAAIPLVIFDVLREAHWQTDWWKVMLPDFGVVIAILEMLHSSEANELTWDANRLHEQSNLLRERNTELDEERNRLAGELNKVQLEVKGLQEERNNHLEQIAKHMQLPKTPAEKNATRLRKYIEEPVAGYNPDGSKWVTDTYLAEVTENDEVIFFMPAQIGSQACAIFADCGQVEITELA